MSREAPRDDGASAGVNRVEGKIALWRRGKGGGEMGRSVFWLVVLTTLHSPPLRCVVMPACLPTRCKPQAARPSLWCLWWWWRCWCCRSSVTPSSTPAPRSTSSSTPAWVGGWVGTGLSSVLVPAWVVGRWSMSACEVGGLAIHGIWFCRQVASSSIPASLHHCF